MLQNNDENNHHFSSSPDPLAASLSHGPVFIRSSPFKNATSLSPSPRKQLSNKNNESTGFKVLGDVTFGSPSKTDNRNTRRKNSSKGNGSEKSHPNASAVSRAKEYSRLSPWRIRVTVEAEPEAEASLKGEWYEEYIGHGGGQENALMSPYKYEEGSIGQRSTQWKSPAKSSPRSGTATSRSRTKSPTSQRQRRRNPGQPRLLDVMESSTDVMSRGGPKKSLDESKRSSRRSERHPIEDFEVFEDPGGDEDETDNSSNNDNNDNNTKQGNEAERSGEGGGKQHIQGGSTTASTTNMRELDLNRVSLRSRPRLRTHARSRAGQKASPQVGSSTRAEKVDGADNSNGRDDNFNYGREQKKNDRAKLPSSSSSSSAPEATPEEPAAAAAKSDLHNASVRRESTGRSPSSPLSTYPTPDASVQDEMEVDGDLVANTVHFADAFEQPNRNITTTTTTTNTATMTKTCIDTGTIQYKGRKEEDPHHQDEHKNDDDILDTGPEVVNDWNDPTDDHAGYDTILESEEFTMIDLESVPSARRYLGSSSPQAQGEGEGDGQEEAVAGAKLMEHETDEDEEGEEAEMAKKVDKSGVDHDDDHTAASATGNTLAPGPISSPMSLPSPYKKGCVSHLPCTTKSAPSPSRPIISYQTEGETELSSNVPWSTPLHHGEAQPEVECGPTPFSLSSSSSSSSSSPPPPSSPIPQPTTTAAMITMTTASRPQTPDAITCSSPNLPSPPRQCSSLLKRKQAQARGKWGDSVSTPPPPQQVIKAGSVLQGVCAEKPGTEGRVLLSSPMEDHVQSRNSLAGEASGDDGAGVVSNVAQVQTRRDTVFKNAATEVALDIGELFEQGAIDERNCNHQTNEDEVERISPAIGGTARPRFANAAASSQGSKTRRNYPQDSTIDEPLTPIVRPTREIDGYSLIDTEAKERRWQQEREAVSRQIEQANASQVIVIDSDDEAEDQGMQGREGTEPYKPDVVLQRQIIGSAENGDHDTDKKKVVEDVKVEPAKVKNVEEPTVSSSRATDDDPFPIEEQRRQRERAREVISRPQRSLIPSPWKRGQNAESSLLSDEGVSGLLWPRWRKSEEKKESAVSSGRLSENMLRIEEPKRNVDSSSRQHSLLNSLSASSPSSSSSPSLPSSPPMALSKTIKIPVNFGDTTEELVGHPGAGKGPVLRPFFPSSSSQLNTPRSAMKGARTGEIGGQIVNLASTRPRVAFSQLSMYRDETKSETSTQVGAGSPDVELPQRSAEPVPDPEDRGSTGGFNQHDDHTARCPASRLDKETRKREVVEDPVTHARADPVPWFAKLVGWVPRSAVTTSAHVCETTTSPLDGVQSISTYKQPKDMRTSAAGKKTEALKTQSGEALGIRCLPGAASSSSSSGRLSSSSDPRVPPPPARLPVSGFFGDDHYKHLHILYLKSLKSTFSRPASIRPGLKSCVGQKRYSGDGEFAWEITERDAEVVERWLRSFEGKSIGVEDRYEVGSHDQDPDAIGKYRQVEWSEKDLLLRLFSIVAGQEVRKDMPKKSN